MKEELRKHRTKLLLNHAWHTCLVLVFFVLAVGARAEGLQDGVTISGQVISDEGEALPGVTVLEKGSSNGVISDIEGNYRITVNQGATLVFSFVGYTSKEVAINGQSTIDVELELDMQQLEEVVVIGYGAVKRRDLTGSVASVDKEDITRIPTHNAMEAIQGRVAGVDIVRSSGAAGAGVNITVRGNRTIGNISDDGSLERANAPLYIIDGFQGGSVSDLNPNDIESIEVLKDASATAIYGYQGANGVIIITTKKGRAGKTKVSYNGFYGINGFTPYPEVRLGEDYVELRREAFRNSSAGFNGSDKEVFPNQNEWEAYQNDEWVNWVDLLMKNGTQQSHTVSVSGGSAKTQAFASVGFFREEGMYRNNDYNRYNVRLNLDHEVKKWIKVGLLTQVTYTDRNGRKDPLSSAISARPLGKAYNENGDIVLNPLPGDPTVISPLADEIPNAYDENSVNTNVNINAYMELTPFKGFSYRTNFGSRLSGGREGEFYDKNSFTRRNQRTSYAGINSNQSRYYHWDNILSYGKEFGQHSLKLTAISNYIFSESDYVYANGLNQPLATQSFYRLDAATTDRQIGSGYRLFETLSFAGRINYSFKGRYLLTVTNRYDGASVLSPGHRWHAFPSVGAAWRIIDEPFMQSIGLLDELKLRASYGVAGNSSISPYSTQSGVYPINNMGFGNVQVSQYQFTGRVGNDQLAWEKSTTYNFGIDAGFFGSRLTMTLDVYNTVTSDILLARNLPQSTGVVDVFENIGETRNRGVELMLNSVNINSNNFRWNTTLTFTRNKEEITALTDTVDLIVNETQSLLIGHPIRSFYTYKKLGIWQTEESEEAANLTFGGSPFQPGDIKMEDVDGDSAITAEDRQFIGATVPDFIIGLQNGFKYKGFDLNIYLVARWGQMINADHLGRYDPSGMGGSLALYDYWTPENPSNDYPRPERTNLSTIPGYQTLTFVEGSYIKLKNVSLGYNLPASALSKLPFDNLRVYVTASNIYALTKSHLLTSYDPEGGGSGSYPINRQLVFGLNFGF